MRTLLAGPWVGEFGWELFCWQGHLRRIAKDYDKVAVACKPGHGGLYTDFADKIIEHPVSSGNTNMFMCESEHGNCLYGKYDCTDYIGGHFNIGFPIDNPEHASVNFKNQEFMRYGSKSKSRMFDLVIHARSTSKLGTNNRNWSKEKWKELVSLFPDTSIVCIGSKEASLHFEGTTDMRGIPIDQLTDVLASSRVTVGPSSGPIHLASLCGCSHVVWSGSTHNKLRYEKYWNPHNTPVEYIHTATGWDADIDEVMQAIRKIT